MSIYLVAVIGYLAALAAVGLWRARAVRTGDDFLVAGRTLPAHVLRLHAALDVDRLGQPVRRRRARLPRRVSGAVAVRRRVGRHRADLLPRAARPAARAVHRPRHPGTALRPVGRGCSARITIVLAYTDDRRLPVPRRRPAAEPRRRHRPAHRRVHHRGVLRRVHGLRRHALGRVSRRRQRRDDDRRHGVAVVYLVGRAGGTGAGARARCGQIS